MEHPGAVILHLGLDEVEVPGLVVRDAHVQLAGHYPVCRLGMWPEVIDGSVFTGRGSET